MCTCRIDTCLHIFPIYCKRVKHISWVCWNNKKYEKIHLGYCILSFRNSFPTLRANIYGLFNSIIALTTISRKYSYQNNFPVTFGDYRILYLCISNSHSNPLNAKRLWSFYSFCYNTLSDSYYYIQSLTRCQCFQTYQITDQSGDAIRRTDQSDAVVYLT